MSDLHKEFLFDLGYLLREEALRTKGDHVAAKGTEDEAFQAGRSLAFYQVISLLISQAESFQLPIKDLHLEGLDPDRDLLGDGTRGV